MGGVRRPTAAIAASTTLATDIDGQILNIGGDLALLSTDRGHMWDTYVPPAPDDQCRTFIPTNPGQEGLGEVSIVQATNGDIISMSWDLRL